MVLRRQYFWDWSGYFVCCFDSGKTNGKFEVIREIIIIIYRIKKYIIIYIFSNNSSTIVDIIMVTLSALLQKSWDLHFGSCSGRLASAVTYISFLVLFNAYSASIIVFLQGTSETIKSFEDLYRAKYDIGVQDVSYNRFYFLVGFVFLLINILNQFIIGTERRNKRILAQPNLSRKNLQSG